MRSSDGLCRCDLSQTSSLNERAKAFAEQGSPVSYPSSCQPFPGASGTCLEAEDLGWCSESPCPGALGPGCPDVQPTGQSGPRSSCKGGGPRCQGHDLSCSGSGSRSFSAPLRTHRSGWEAEACPLGVLWGEHDGGRLSSRLGSSCPLGWQVSAVSYRKTLQLFSGLSDDRESELFSVSPRHSGANR